MHINYALATVQPPCTQDRPSDEHRQIYKPAKCNNVEIRSIDCRPNFSCEIARNIALEE